ncbi:MAG: sensor histidine kinase [Dichotomicrobium sp.]
MFAVAAALAMGYVYWQTSVFYARQLNETIGAEIRGLAEQYRLGGLPRLNEVVAQRSASAGAGLYLIADEDGERISGNFGSPSAELLQSSGRVQFPYRAPAPGGSERRLAIGQIFTLPDGYRLFVGRDIEDRRELEQLFATAFLWGVGLIAVIGVLGGLLVSRVLLRRIGVVTDTSQRIMHGDLSQRVPITGTGDELDRLAGNLNTMFDRIEQLVNGLREVSDNIAHDLKTPLTRMRNRIDTALREAPDETAYRETLIQTIEEADELIRTFNALLSIARLEAGAQVEDFETFDLAALAGDAVELYEPVAESEGMAISLAADAQARVTANRQLLAQATANLIDNAIKYARPEAGDGVSPAIAVRVERNGANIRLSVADNGPGIPPEQRERALKRFTRLESSRSRAGSGLGLSLVAAVARLHGGRVVLEDNQPGLRVVVSLPAADGPNAQTQTQTGAAPS